MGPGTPTQGSGPLQEQQALLTTEPSLQHLNLHCGLFLLTLLVSVAVYSVGVDSCAQEVRSQLYGVVLSFHLYEGSGD